MSKYSLERSNIRSGDLLAWSIHRLDSLRSIARIAIRLATASEFDHVAVAWVVSNRLMAIEATYPYVRIYPLSRLLPFYYIPMGIEWNDQIEAYLMNRIGDEYSILQAIQSYLFNPPDDRRWQCAELVNSFYKNINIGLKNAYTPSMVVEQCLNISTSGLKLVHDG